MTATRRRRTGHLLVIGGNEDRDEGDMLILPRLVQLAGGARARLLVCAVASEEPASTLAAYRRVFEKIGVAEVHSAAIRDRDAGEHDRLLRALDRATGVFLTGGDQLRITSVMAGTTFGDRLRRRFEESFWSEDQAFYAMALDGEKRRCDAIASNAHDSANRFTASAGFASLVHRANSPTIRSAAATLVPTPALPRG